MLQVHIRGLNGLATMLARPHTEASMPSGLVRGCLGVGGHCMLLCRPKRQRACADIGQGGSFTSQVSPVAHMFQQVACVCSGAKHVFT